MTDNPTSSPPEPRRTMRLATRWIAASLVVAIAFAGARVTTRPDASARESATAAPAPDSPGHSEAPPSTTTADPGDSYEDLLDDIFGESEPDSGSAPVAPEGEWATASGSGAAGGTWTMQYPSEWSLEEVDKGLVTFSASGRPDVAMVATRPFVGPFEAETDRDLDQLVGQLEDGEVTYYEPATIQDREATQANLRYTNPDGELAGVSITWIRDGRTIYLIAGEAPLEDRELQSRIEATLNSFTVGDSA
jgi:hypothetical protein